MSQLCKMDLLQHRFTPMVSSSGLELQNHWFGFGMWNLRFVFLPFFHQNTLSENFLCNSNVCSVGIWRMIFLIHLIWISDKCCQVWRAHRTCDGYIFLWKWLLLGCKQFLSFILCFELCLCSVVAASNCLLHLYPRWKFWNFHLPNQFEILHNCFRQVSFVDSKWVQWD